MSPIFIGLSIILIAVCVAVITLILLQKKRSAGMGGVIGGAGGSTGGTSTYWDKNKGRSLEGMLERYTKIGAAVFLVLCFALGFVR